MRVPVVVTALVVSVTTACLQDLPDSDLDWRRSAQGGDSNVGVMAPAPSAEPEFGETTRAEPAPPPLSGGTLAAVPGRAMVVAADPDRDLVYVVDVETHSVATVALERGAEPGRVVVDESLRAHVALRAGAALVTIDLANGNAVTKRAVCSLPRGVAWEKETDDVHVACASGELVTFAASGGPAKRKVHVARDLRDVVVTPHGLVVSTFRNADVIRLAKDGSVQAQSAGIPASGKARVAWRMIASPSSVATTEDDPAESVMMAAQQTPDELAVPPPAPPAYYESISGCDAGGPLSLIADRRQALVVPNAVLPVDLATDGVRMMIVAAGNAHVPDKAQLLYLTPKYFGVGCASAGDVRVPMPAELTSVVYEPITDRFYALSREPAALLEIELSRMLVHGSLPLSNDSRRDTGHAIFHASAGRGGTACASCHPEGRDDGHSWRSLLLGARRTPSLIGTVAGTAPYHWNGEASGLEQVMTITFTGRMRGPELRDDQKGAVASWLDELPGLPRSSSSLSFSPAVVRGRTIFESTTARCASCHAGSLFTNNATIDVGTGGALQVPSLLGVVHHAPYLHDGSHPHLRSILRSPHGGATVRADEVDDLAAYLESL
jgi:hypothetical protein